MALNPDCPLAIFRPENDRRSGSVGPESGEPGAFSTGHGQHQAVLAGVPMPRSANGQHQAMKGGQRRLDSGTQHGLTIAQLGHNWAQLGSDSIYFSQGLPGASGSGASGSGLRGHGASGSRGFAGLRGASGSSLNTVRLA